MTSIRAFLQLLKTAPISWLVGLLVLMLLSSLTEGIGLVLLVPMLGVLGNKEMSSNPVVQKLVELIQTLGLPISLVGLLVCFLALVAIRNIIQYSRERLSAHLQHQVVDTMRVRCFLALLNVEWRWIVTGRQSDHATLLLGDISRIGVGLNFGLGLTVSIISGIAYLSTAFILSWPMTALACSSAGLVFWLLAGQRRTALLLGQNLGRVNRALHGNLHETLNGIKLTKIFGNENRHLHLFSQTTSDVRKQQLSFLASTSRAKVLFQMAGAILTAVYLYIGMTVLNMPLPELIVLVMLFSRMVPLFMTSHQHYHHWLHAMPAINDINTLLAECRQQAEPKSVPEESQLQVDELICLDNVTVRYKDRDLPALRNVTLRFPARTTTAIMGPSGAGKSTLADVLAGLLAPDSGQMIIDGSPVVKARRLHWRHSVAYVPQEVFLFHDTVRSNLLWGAPEATEQQLQKALKRSAANFVDDLPQGMDTVVGDGGVLLSGGERQRIALARALLKRPSLLILDEATSALDKENETRIRNAIENLHGDMTVVIIGHRLPTLEHADKVVVLDNGRITAEGKWKDVRKYLELE